MTSVRKRKAAIGRALLRQSSQSSLDDALWDRPIGREFGSPDFELLMEQDRRNGVGVFDPALKGMYSSSVEVPEELAVQRRKLLGQLAADFDKRLAALRAPDAAQKVSAVFASGGKLTKRPRAGAGY